MKTSPITSHDIHAQVQQIIQAANLAPATRDKYWRAIQGYLATGHSLTDQAALAAYAATLTPSRRAHLKSAVRKWTDVMAARVKATATPDTVPAVQAALYRFDALQEAIQVARPAGKKVHTWLSAREVRRLLQLPDTSTPRGRRDKIVLGLCVAAGLRRTEAV